MPEIGKVQIMPGKSIYIVCRNNQVVYPDAGFHRILQDPPCRITWMPILEIKEEDIIKSTHAC